MSLELALIGDVHGCWTDADTAYFNSAAYAALLFTGDLPPFVGAGPVARRLSGLRVPAYLVPGNHDGAGAWQFLAELRGRTRLAAILGAGQPARERRLRAALGPVKLVGYSIDPLAPGLSLIAARPYSMGGDRLYFASHLARAWNVHGLEDSAARLCALVDQAPGAIVFLAHNGPSGLGEARDDIWGCDFRRGGGDFGDRDLRAAIDHACASRKPVLAVVAGHMHRRLRGGGERRAWQVERDGVLYVNAARVPRIRRDGTRHHVALTIDDAGVRAREIWV